MPDPAGGSDDGRLPMAALVHVACSLPGSDVFKVSALVGIDVDRLMDLSGKRADASQAEVSALRAYVEQNVRMARRPLVMRKAAP